MKDIFDYVTKLLPQPLLLALLFTAAVFFGVYYHHSYRSFGDAFRDTTFRSVGIVSFAIALLYMVHRRDDVGLSGSPIVVVPQFSNDTEDAFRNPIVADLSFRLDKTLGRTDTVLRIRAFVADPKSARAIMADYGANAILYDASVNTIGDQHMICMKLITKEVTSSPCIPPFDFKERAACLDSVTVIVAGRIAAAESAEYPVLKRLADVEQRLGQLSAAIQNNSRTTAPSFPSYTSKTVLIVGINEVQQLQARLRFARPEAEELAQLLTAGYGCTVQTLFDEKATRAAVLQALDVTASRLVPQSLFVFVFFGYGAAEVTAGGSVSSVCLYDSAPNGALTAIELISAIKKIPSHHKLMIVDACHSTAGVPSIPPTSPVTDPSLPVTMYLGSCQANEMSYETSRGGSFSRSLIDVLRNASSRPIKGIWMGDLLTEVRRTMDNEPTQTPALLIVEGKGDIALERQ